MATLERLAKDDPRFKILMEKISKMNLSQEEISEEQHASVLELNESTEVMTISGPPDQPKDVDIKILSVKVDEILKYKEESSPSPEELEAHGKEIEDQFLQHKESLIKEDKINYWLKLGELYSVTKTDKRLAIESLSKVVKLDPKVREAWNVLADCYWHGGDYVMAQKCLETSLELERAKEPLRNLSIIYRKLALKDPERGIENTQTGVRLAKEAVNKDLKDSISWGILGNAYLSAYFNLNSDIKSAQLALSAYKQAVKLSTNRMSTELFYNQALASKYCEYYEEALASLDMAINQEKDWDPAAKLKCQLLVFLNNVQFFHTSKGKLKPKRISKFQKELLNVQLGSYVQSLNAEASNVTSLQTGKNHNVLIYGKVIWTLAQQESFPFTCGCLEASGECFVVSVYNVTPGKGFLIGDTLFVPKPNYKLLKFEYDGITYDFPSIRVDNPTYLIVNKKRLSSDYFTPYTLSTSEKEAM